MKSLICQILLKQYYLNHKSKCEKTYNFSTYLLPIAFIRDIHEEYLSLEDADNKHSNFATELKHFDKGIKAIEK